MDRLPPGRRQARPAGLRAGPCWVAALVLLSAFGAASAAGAPTAAGHPTSRAPAALSVPALSTNTSVLDLGMALNASVNTSAITGGSGNATNLTFTWSGLPTNCTSQNVSNYTCVPTATGKFAVALTVTDFSDNQTGTAGKVNVTVNSDPVVTSLVASKTNLSVDQSVTFTVSASGGTAPLTYLYSGLPSGCSGNTSVVNCTPTTAAAYNVSVSVIDAVNFSSGSAFVVVRVAPASPASSSPKPTTGQWGIIAGILVVGLAIAGYLWVRARREEKGARPPPPRAPPPPATPPTDGPPPGPAAPK